MNKVTAHRGPDGTGVFVADGISLGHNRLSILDVSAGASQPMRSDGGRFVITFNGEIYNFAELKAELSDYAFKTKSDTEVILVAYRKWGREAVKKFNGIFALAIWDTQEKELFLARDRSGLKPLYYHHAGGTFIFSSEIKGILEHPIPRKLNREAFSIYMRVLYTPAPLTLFEDIQKFPQGQYGVFKDGKLTLINYTEASTEAKLTESFAVLAKTLKEKVSASVKRQLVSDRPIGVYLSGGIDSSAVLHAVSETRANIDTFSVGFSLPDKKDEEKFNADFYLARETAKHYGTRHLEVLFSEEDALRYLLKAIYALDEPISNPTALPMMRLAEFTKKEGVDVVLGGDGGDELFGGYERYRLSLWASTFQKLPSFVRKLLSVSGRFKKLNTPVGIERFALFMFQKDDVLSRVLKAGTYDADAGRRFFANRYFPGWASSNMSHVGRCPSNTERTFEEQFMNVDRHTWLSDESLMRTDKMSMSAGVEARAPLLDNELVDFSARIPFCHNVTLSGTKRLLKQAFRGHIPDALFKQPKRGWFSPGAKWLRNLAFLAEVKKILSADYYAPTASLFNWEGLTAMLESHRSGEKYNFTCLWAIVTFQVWARLYKVSI